MTDFPVIKVGEDITRQVLSDYPEMMVVAFRSAATGAIGALHNHRHVQSTYVEKGRFRFILADEEREVGAGDNFVTPSDMVHGCLCLEPGTLIDYFTPRRDDFL